MSSLVKKSVVVAVSGGFDPIHVGHIRLFREAKKLGDKLVVILNNDNWLRKKKGYIFMPQDERKEVIEAIKNVDRVILTHHPKNPKDMSVCPELHRLRPNIFANGGDRTKKNIPEVAVCKKIGCKMVFGVGQGGKVQSSSWLLEKFAKTQGKNIKTVLDILKKEVAGDVQGALKMLAPGYSMTWVYKAKDGTLFPRTIRDIKKELEEVYYIKGRKYDIKNITEGKNVVIVEVVESYPDPKTKKVYRTPLAIVLEMKNGKIQRGRHYCDPRLSYLYLTPKQIDKIFK